MTAPDKSSASLLQHQDSFHDAEEDDDVSSRTHNLKPKGVAKSKNWHAIILCLWIISLTTVAWFIFTVAAEYVLHIDHNRNCDCGLPTDSLLGDVAWKPRILDPDERFVTTDPGDIDGSNVTQIWDEIFPSAWIAVPDPSAVGFGGGVNLLRDGQDSDTWDAKTEGFSVAVMHQIHCVAILKHSFMLYRQDAMSEDIELEHIDHCVEYLRQTLICHGDLTLERPSMQTYPQGATGWGEMHQCRDWDQLISVVKKLAIVRAKDGWVKAA
ncbi:hypothetical protein E4U31_007661 [Claviceps sp. LM219 group G6]|nr:hypothetical protein E4U31_007661 [Claviceps sp. LM219 group G6]